MYTDSLGDKFLQITFRPLTMNRVSDEFEADGSVLNIEDGTFGKNTVIQNPCKNPDRNP